MRSLNLTRITVRSAFVGAFIAFGIRQASAALFVSSFTQNTVSRYDEDSGAFIDTFVSAGSGGLTAPHRARHGPDGHFYVASANNDRVLRYDGLTGEFIGIFAAAPQLDYPVDFEWGADGNLYVSSQLSDSIVRFNGVTGAFIDVFVASGSGGLDGPSGIQFLGGDLYVSGRMSGEAYRYDGITGAFELAFGATQIDQGFGLDFDASGSLYVASGNSNRVSRFDPASGNHLGDFVSAGSGGLSGLIGIEFGPDGSLYAASFDTNSVKRFAAGTGASLGDFVLPGSGGLANPNFISFSTIPEPCAAVSWVFAAGLMGMRRRVNRPD